MNDVGILFGKVVPCWGEIQTVITQERDSITADERAVRVVRAETTDTPTTRHVGVRFPPSLLPKLSEHLQALDTRKQAALVGHQTGVQPFVAGTPGSKWAQPAQDFMIKVPDGATAGQMVQFNAPDGSLLKVKLPKGVTAGQHIKIQQPAAVNQAPAGVVPPAAPSNKAPNGPSLPEEPTAVVESAMKKMQVAVQTSLMSFFGKKVQSSSTPAGTVAMKKATNTTQKSVTTQKIVELSDLDKAIKASLEDVAPCGGVVDFVGDSGDLNSQLQTTCMGCLQAKVKCSRGTPCKRCSTQGLSCVPSTGAPSAAAAAKPRKSEPVKSRKEKRALPAVTSVRDFFSKKAKVE